MRTIAVMNQKGGVGKTTTSVNLAAGLARQGCRVCIIDLDPQAHASLHLGVETRPEDPTIYEVFTGTQPLAASRRLVASNLWVIPSDIGLAGVEQELAQVAGREHILRQALQEMLSAEPFDYVIIDCPPSLGILTVNALTAVGEVFIPLQPHFFALQGLSKLFETTAVVGRRLNRNLKVTGIVMCLYETGTRLATDVTEDLAAFLERSDADAPWAEARIFEQKIRRNIKLAEAPSYGQSVFDYAANCPGALDYSGLALEVLSCDPASGNSDPLQAAA